MSECDGYKQFVGSRIKISVDAATEKPYCYKGVVVDSNIDILTIKDDVSGIVYIPKRRIISMKLNDGGFDG